MINSLLNPVELQPSYLSAEPFPHAVIDGFLVPDVAEMALGELLATDTSTWHADDHDQQVNKRWMNEPERLSPVTAGLLRYLNSPAALDFFEKLTAIEGLLPDPSFVGGGVHVSSTGGRLGIHSDFNLHPVSGRHRRVNALVFLNKDWEPDWNGQLELWDRDLRRPVQTIEPHFNRLVAFTITDNAFHGVPKPLRCPPDRKRLSLALYYYTEDRPAHEKAPFHWAAWQQPTGESAPDRTDAR